MIVKPALARRNTVILANRQVIHRRALPMTGTVLQARDTGGSVMSNTNQKMTIEDIATHYVMRTCPHCLQDYILGVEGIENGCDRCEGIIRKPDGSIDFDAISADSFEKFLKRVS